MKKLKNYIVLITVFALIISCKEMKEPEWVKARLIADDLDSPSALHTDDNFIYYVTGGNLASLKAGTSGVWKKSIEGGEPIQLFKGFQKDELTVILPQTFVLTTDEKYLYFAAGNIYRIPKEGGEAKQITPGMPTEMIVDEDNIYWQNFVGEGMNPTPVYSINQNGGEVKVLTDPKIILDIAADKENLYWAQPDGIYKTPKKGGTKSLIITPKNGSRINGMILEQNSIYFLNDNTICMIPKNGDASVELVSNVNIVHKFFADENNLYFVRNEGSFGTSINKIPIKGGNHEKIDSGYIKSYTVGKDKIYVSDSSKIYELLK